MRKLSSGQRLTDTTTPLRYRNRKALNCTLCIEKKIKCDRQQPCEECIKRKKQDKCKYEPSRPATGPDNTTSRALDKPGIQHCLDQLEQPIDERASAQTGPPFPVMEYTFLNYYTCYLTSMWNTDGEDKVELMLSKFFHVGGLVACMLHEGELLKKWRSLRQCPTAGSQYEAFSFLAILYGSISLTILFCNKLGDALPGGTSPTSQILDICIENCRQCWQNSDPEMPGKYKVEAIILRLAITLYHKFDLRRAYTVLGQAIALSEASGYDDSHNSKAWELVQHFNYYLRFYSEKAQTVSLQPRQARPLRDFIPTESSKHSIELPPSKLPLQFSPTLMLILVGKIRGVSTAIGLEIFNRRHVTFQEIWAYDQELNTIYEQTPREIIGDLAEIIQLQCTTAISYHAAKIVLHRWSVLGTNLGKSDANATSSRSQCIKSAVVIINIQIALLDNRCSGQGRWELDPLTMFDFLLAGTILGIELKYLTRHRLLLYPNRLRQEVVAGTDLCKLLRSSLKFWQNSGNYGAPADTAGICKTLSLVLDEAGVHPLCDSQHAQLDSNDLRGPRSPAQEMQRLSQDALYQHNFGGSANWDDLLSQVERNYFNSF